jgi:predicted Zn-dependent peptidase
MPERHVNKSALANGIRILTYRMPYVRSVTMGVWVNVGARDEAVQESGLSHFIEHMIFKGTSRRSAYQIAKEFDAIGGLTNAFTAMENTCYHAKVMDTHLETMVDILSDIFLNSTFAESEIEKERPVIFQEIGMLQDAPDEYVHHLSGQTFWGDHPLGRSILGSPENVRLFDARQIKAFFRRLYQPDRILIAAAGNIKHQQLVDLCGPFFESIQTGNGFPERKAPEICAGTDIHYRKLEQVHLCLNTRGLSITDPNRYTLALINTLLGGNMSSRLFQQVRERHGLAYSVYSFISSFVDTGMLGVYAAVAPENGRRCLQLVLGELKKLKTVPITDAELTNAKEFTKGNLLLASESNDNQMVRLAQNEIHFGRYTPIKEVLDRIDNVSAGDISELANYLLQDRYLTLTALGPVADAATLESALTV